MADEWPSVRWDTSVIDTCTTSNLTETPNIDTVQCSCGGVRDKEWGCARMTEFRRDVVPFIHDTTMWIVVRCILSWIIKKNSILYFILANTIYNSVVVKLLPMYDGNILKSFFVGI